MKSESESRKVNKYAVKMCSELKSICSMSSVQKQLKFQVFLLNILHSLFNFGKCLSMSLIRILTMSVFT